MNNIIQLSKLKKIKSNFPVLIGTKAVSAKVCKNLISEIRNSNTFDDMIMGGRNRINKGSKNFKKHLKKSKISAKLYNQFNNKSFYKKIEKLFKKKFDNKTWSNVYNPIKFNKEKFTIKKKLNSNQLTKLFGTNYRKPSVNLDIDFSVSKGGYRLRAHRDDVNRLYNFLIYLTDIPKKNGGSLTIYKKKSNKKMRKSFRRFPKSSELNTVKQFSPKQGTVVFFQSTPNSYHGVNRFKEIKCQKRFFIYGSYALNKPVIWKFNDNYYYPKVVHSKKKMLTSFHDINYLTKETDKSIN